MKAPLALYFSEVAREDLLGKQEERDCVERAAQGDERARDALVRANLRLVIKVAKKFAGRGVDQEDLIAAGNVGLLTAAAHVDPAFRNRFSTYAVFWIEQAMRGEIERMGTPVHIPRYVLTLLKAYWRAEQAARNETGQAGTVEEVCDRAGLSDGERLLVQTALHGTGAQLLHDAIPAPPDAGQHLADTEEEVRDLLRFLDNGKRALLEQRYGIGRERRTEAEIAQERGVSKQAVNATVQLSLRQLRLLLEGRNRSPTA